MTRMPPYRPNDGPTQPALKPHPSGYAEQPFGPTNGRRRIGLSTIAGSADVPHRCRDHGRRAQVTTWTRLPRVRRWTTED